MTAPRVVIVGGGVSGLATAALLARGGASVTVVEQNAQLGGRMGKLERDGLRFDTGPSWFLMRDAFVQFFALLGKRLDDELDLIDLDVRYRVYFEGDDPLGPGEKLEVVSDADTNWATFDSLSPGEGALMRAYAQESQALYGLALRRFLYTTFQNPVRALNGEVLRKSLRLPALLGRSLGAHIAGKIRDPRLRQILGFHAVFLGSSPDRAPALFALMSHLDLGEGVQYPRGGLYAVIDAVARAAAEEGATLRTDARVKTIVTRHGLATGVRLESGEILAADLVVGATDMHHIETQLLEPAERTMDQRTWDRKTPGVSALLAFVDVTGPLPELEHHTLFFSRDWDANFSAIAAREIPPHPASIYVSRTTATDASAAPAGHEALVMLVPFPADAELGATSVSRERVRAHAEQYLEQVGAWAAIPDLMERARIVDLMMPADFAQRLSAWQGSALGLEHTLKQSAMFRPANVSAKVGNLVYAGASTVPGVGVPMCLISAELVVKRLLGDTSATPTPGELAPGFLASSRARGVLGSVARGDGHTP
jgi:phytoene desaturase